MTTTYYDAIKQSLAKIDAVDRKVRWGFYDRARALLAERLGSREPPMLPADFTAELAAFDAAIERVEAEFVPPAATAAPAAVAASTRRAAPPRPHAKSDPRQPVGDDAVEPAASTRKFAVVIGAAAACVIAVIGGLAWWGSQDVAPPAAPARPAPAVAARPAPAAVTPVATDLRRSTSPDSAQAGDKLPYVLRRQLVYYRSTHPAGTIVIAKSQHHLYVVKNNSAALRYTIALGSDCVDAAGLFSVAQKDEPPANPNPVIHLDKSNYRIRAADMLAAIGQYSRTQGFQLMHDDIADLNERTPLGTRVIVTN